MNVSRHLKMAAAKDLSARIARLGKDAEPPWTVHAHTILEWLELDVPPDEMSERIATLGVRQGETPWEVPEQTIAAVLDRHYNKPAAPTPATKLSPAGRKAIKKKRPVKATARDE